MLENIYVNFEKKYFFWISLHCLYKRKNFESFFHLKMYLQYTKIQKQFQIC